MKEAKRLVEDKCSSVKPKKAVQQEVCREDKQCESNATRPERQRWSPNSFKAAYAEKLKDPRWQKKRLEIFNRDKWTCRDCESTEKTLHVHHCLYINGKEPWDYNNGDLRTLCWQCHEDRGSVEHDVKLEFARLLALMTRDQIAELMPQILTAKLPDNAANGVFLMPLDYFEYKSDQRWFCRAWDEPSMRPHYEAVTGCKIKWEGACRNDS